MSFFGFELLFDASVKEECDVGVFFGFCVSAEGVLRTGDVSLFYSFFLERHSARTFVIG